MSNNKSDAREAIRCASEKLSVLRAQTAHSDAVTLIKKDSISSRHMRASALPSSRALDTNDLPAFFLDCKTLRTLLSPTNSVQRVSIAKKRSARKCAPLPLKKIPSALNALRKHSFSAMCLDLNSILKDSQIVQRRMSYTLSAHTCMTLCRDLRLSIEAFEAIEKVYASSILELRQEASARAMKSPSQMLEWAISHALVSFFAQLLCRTLGFRQFDVVVEHKRHGSLKPLETRKKRGKLHIALRDLKNNALPSIDVPRSHCVRRPLDHVRSQESADMDLTWLRRHCGQLSKKAKFHCHRISAAKFSEIFLRRQKRRMGILFHRWMKDTAFQRNQMRARAFLRYKFLYKNVCRVLLQASRLMEMRFRRWRMCMQLERLAEMTSVALEIQRFERGRRDRRRVRDYRQFLACVSIQSHIRGHLYRQFLRREKYQRLLHNSATLLQRNYRRYAAQQLLIAVRKAQKRLFSCKKIQNAYRIHRNRQLLAIARQLRIERSSAICIQHSVQSYLAHRRARKHSCAIEIQCYFRRHLARREHYKRTCQRAQRKAAMMITQYAKRSRTRKWLLLQRLQRDAIIRIQIAYRKFQAIILCRRLLMEQIQKTIFQRKTLAVSRLQRQWRLFQSHSELLRLRNLMIQARNIEILRVCLHIQRITRGYLGRSHVRALRQSLRKDRKRHRQSHSAMQIQRHWRGFRVRRMEKSYIQIHLSWKRQERGAVQCLQRFARRYRVQRRKRLHRKAATSIQCKYRQYKAQLVYKNVKQRKKEEMEGALERLSRELRTSSVCMIQRRVRVFLARIVLEQHIALAPGWRDTVRAAITIQRHVRERHARKVSRQVRHEMERKIAKLASKKAKYEISRVRKEEKQRFIEMERAFALEKQKALEEIERLRRQLESGYLSSERWPNEILKEETLRHAKLSSAVVSLGFSTAHVRHNREFQKNGVESEEQRKFRLKHAAALRIQSFFRARRAQRIQIRIGKERHQMLFPSEYLKATLNTEEMEEWVEYWDDTAQAMYYHNPRTDQVTWTRPLTHDSYVQSNVYPYTTAIPYIPHTKPMTSDAWQSAWDPNARAMYYYNNETGQTYYAAS